MTTKNSSYPILLRRTLEKFLVLVFLFSFFVITAGPLAHAVDYTCNRTPNSQGTEPIWTTSKEKNLDFIVSWSFDDPENCVVSAGSSDNFFYSPRAGKTYYFPAKWTVTHDNGKTLVSAETSFPIQLLESLANRNYDGNGLDLVQVSQEYKVIAPIFFKNQSIQGSLTGKFGLAQLWGIWFSKNQGLFPDNCNPDSSRAYSEERNTTLKTEVSWKILESGQNPRIEIRISETSNCIFLVHSGPIDKIKSLSTSEIQPAPGKFQAEHAFWDGEAPAYFNKILSEPKKLVQVGIGEFTTSPVYEKYHLDFKTDITPISIPPTQIIEHSDSVTRKGNEVVLTTTLDASKLNLLVDKFITVYVGFYNWYTQGTSFTSGGWTIKYSGNSWTARYYPGGTIPGGSYMFYTTRALKIPVFDLIASEVEKAAAELKAKQEAEAKAAAELKAKQEAEAKAAAELKAKQEAEAKATADKIAAIKAAAEAAADARAAEIKAEEEAAAKAAASKKTTITCVKGKLTKKVTAIKPVCPSGYKKK